MIIYLVGMSCVGKSTVGKMLADRLGYLFFDLDQEIEKYYQLSIERLQSKFLTMNEYRTKASVVLNLLFSKSQNSVIAGVPSGLKFAYLKVYKQHKTKDLLSIYLKDSLENIVERLTFYDIDSNPITEIIDDAKKNKYLKELREDYYFFYHSYKRADFQVDIQNIPLDKIPEKIIATIEKTTLLPSAHERMLDRGALTKTDNPIK